MCEIDSYACVYGNSAAYVAGIHFAFPGWVNLDDWLHTEINFWHWELAPDSVTIQVQVGPNAHLLIVTNVQPLSQSATSM